MVYAMFPHCVYAMGSFFLFVLLHFGVSLNSCRYPSVYLVVYIFICRFSCFYIAFSASVAYWFSASPHNSLRYIYRAKD